MTTLSNRTDLVHGIVRPSGHFGSGWPSHHTLTQGFSGSLSMAGWTAGNEGFPQQTFLGASIRSFNLNAGFGDTTSTLSVELVNDEYNESDGTFVGSGDDVYHNSVGGDKFSPPVVGAPVFFKFGGNPANTEQAYRKTFDDTYPHFYLPDHFQYVGAESVLDPSKVPDWFGGEKYTPPINGGPLDVIPTGAFPDGAMSLSGVSTDGATTTWLDKSVLWHSGTPWRGRNHFVFGGILQSYTQNRSPAGNPLYSVQVTDPREILSNAVVLLNNYQGTTFNNKNLFNVYGFLEHDLTDRLQQQLNNNCVSKSILTKITDTIGNVGYFGINHDGVNFPPEPLQATGMFGSWNPFLRGNGGVVGNKNVGLIGINYPVTPIQFEFYASGDPNWGQLRDVYDLGPSMHPGRLLDLPLPVINANGDIIKPVIPPPTGQLPRHFPITGQGFSRRSDRGIPWYRVSQGLAALFNYNGLLPQEYINAGFGGAVDFRGYKYIVDFAGLPLDHIPPMYFMDFDQLTLLELAQEICDITSHDMFVSLLPIIEHPASQFIYEYNKALVNLPTPGGSGLSNLIAGIIRVDGIDKSRQPKYGAIKSYLDTLIERDVNVESQDLGYELSNVTTDKFVAGAQEVEMYYFSNNKDRDNLELRKYNNGLNSHYELLQAKQWDLSTSLSQQILPFYGFLGVDKAVTIPRGFGAYQQIMLDATSLDAYGVGNYYIATELELRAALVSYDQWRNFLLQYDEVYVQELTENQTWQSTLAPEIGDNVEGLYDELEEAVAVSGVGNVFRESLQDDAGNQRRYGVSVPRCVFNSDRPEMGADGYPASPCSPPYGYPLYYKRAEKIGIPEAGIVSIQSAVTSCMSNIERLQKKIDNNAQEFKIKKEDALEQVKKLELDLSRTLSLGEREANPETKLRLLRRYSDLSLALNEAKAFANELDSMLAAADKSDKFELQETKDVWDASTRLIKNMSRMGKEHLKNAKKVYNFVKKVAEENLGKKFLVKIPKSCNMNYDNQIQIDITNPQIISYSGGPFGFKPHPVNNQFNFGMSASFSTGNPDIGMFGGVSLYQAQISTDDAHEHYLNVDHFLSFNHPYYGSGAYSYGALKGNFNPISEKWEFNYKPEPQGGFFNFALYNRNLAFAEASNLPYEKLAPMTKQFLAPMDLTNLLNGSNRVSCYARYDNSQNLEFTNVDAKSIAQQSFTAGGFIPDVAEELNNLHPDRQMDMRQIQARLTDDQELQRQGPSVAYVKCDLSEELYMPPLISGVETKVWARGYKIKISKPQTDIEFTMISGCKVPKVVKRRLEPSFEPSDDFHVYGTTTTTTTTAAPPGTPTTPTPATTTTTEPPLHKADVTVMNEDFFRFRDERLKGDLVVSRLDYLDSDHVYAIITLPGRIKPAVDMRYMDGPLAAFNTVKMYNIMTRDVVRGVPGFEKPEPVTNGDQLPKLENVKEFSFKDLGEARRLQKQSVKQLSLADRRLDFASPSPVFPSMVAMPLMSMERCYGPWLSAASLDPSTGSLGVTNIGGKIEFVKDENLAPWNYAGYQLMNEAGSLEAQFSNSLLLFSERGGFVFPQAPTGIGLAKALKDGGPLVTSISVDVGTDKISTSVKMDLYTSSFGKLQKQKEGNIATMSRERQKIIDQNNSAIRRGLGKSSTNANLFGGLLDDGGKRIIEQARGTQEYFSEVEKGEAKRATYIAASKEAHDQGKPIGGTLPAIARAVDGWLGDEKDIVERTALGLDGNTTDSFSAKNWAMKLVGQGKDAVLGFISNDHNDDDHLPKPVPLKKTRE